MRILLLTQVVPNPPDAGPKIKTHYVLRSLATEHEIELITFARDEDERRAAAELDEWCVTVTDVALTRHKLYEPLYTLRGWARLRPFLVERDIRREFDRLVRQRLASGEIDVLHADQLSMARYIPLAKKYGVLSVFDAHNAVWDLVRDEAPRQRRLPHRAAARIEWRLLRRFEGQMSRLADLTLAVTEIDRSLLEEAAGCRISAQVVPIGVEGQDSEPVEMRADASHLLNVSTLIYPPNVDGLRWFRDQVWPLIARAVPDVTVDIVGKRPPVDIDAWGEHDLAVQVHGYVPDLQPLYENCAVYIVPLLSGSGMRVKILEAMARGLPVVTTSVGAAGLDVVSDRHLIIADTPQDFASAARRLLESPDLRRELGTSARRLVLERYDWRVCGEPLLRGYRQLQERLPGAGSDPLSPSRNDIVAKIPHSVDRI